MSMSLNTLSYTYKLEVPAVPPEPEPTGDLRKTGSTSSLGYLVKRKFAFSK